MNSQHSDQITTLPFSTISDDEANKLLKKYQIALTVDEARKISEMLGRDPTVVEAVLWGIQGSEHCSYKSSSKFLKTLPTESSHVILGPGEDSGIVAITDEPKGKRWGIVISHESHNHPSQIVPYEGAATGIGGVVRDVVCMGSRVIGSMDLLRLGDLKTEESKTIAAEVARGIAGYGNPLGIPNLGGDTVFDSSYNSNCLVNAIAIGIVREDEFIHSYVPKEAGKVGYDIILVGKPTDRSGFGGASFASAAMDEEEKDQNTGAVQEPNPFLERHLLASTYALFDWLAANKKLNKVSFKDLGAGGVVCASVEQVADQGFGAVVNLDNVHVSMENLPPEVIALAETQERFCWTCHPDLTEHILNHYNTDWDLPSIAEGARASLIGKVTTDGIYKLSFKGNTVVEAKALDITCGLSYEREMEEVVNEFEEPEIECDSNEIIVESRKSKVEGLVKSPKSKDLRPLPSDKTFDIRPSTFKTTISEVFKTMLSHPNYASTTPVTIHYDKNVIGNTIIEAGEADAGVITPLQDLASHVQAGTHPSWLARRSPDGEGGDLSDEMKKIGVAFAGDGNGRYGRISPYLEGVNATVESMRNVATVGATPRAFTDCLNYGNPEIPDQLWQLAEGIRGIAKAAGEIKVDGECVPIVSGNVSLYNAQPDGSAIAPTAIVCCVGVIREASKAITMQIKKPDSILFMIGERKNECGGSAYYEILEQMTDSPHDALLGNCVPDPDIAEVSSQISFITQAIDNRLVYASHDISNGGLMLALFEMTLPQRNSGGNIGIEVDLKELESSLRPDTLLFTETGGFIIEVDEKNVDALKDLAEKNSVKLTQIGKTLPSQELKINDGNKVLLSEKLNNLRETWTFGLEKAIN
ncbi:phosphoribosylformylglycinamidine synthase subunit PurL [Patescibacteria group bacterium]|nr:phosphoribosylformylglycinamidine synthase subunit PurL [Patescibacteria group bacterium]MBU1124144.1 phosphoribosylformylglycinamidine synthase subunit PurL [Patescibacteria group bacterium]MBU1911759.1 phosphoribosylformylglycinamidine synthase subunit PurL [Patescibacteria group bacterium]